MHLQRKTAPKVARYQLARLFLADEQRATVQPAKSLEGSRSVGRQFPSEQTKESGEPRFIMGALALFWRAPPASQPTVAAPVATAAGRAPLACDTSS